MEESSTVSMSHKVANDAICVANSSASTKATSVEQTCKYCKFLSRGGHTLKRSEFWEDHLIDHLDAAQIRTILPCRELSAKTQFFLFNEADQALNA